MTELAFLSPDLTSLILDGTQPEEMTLHRSLKGEDFPIDWHQQGQW